MQAQTMRRRMAGLCLILAQAHLAMDHMDMALAYGLDALALDGDAVQTYELHLFIGYIHAQMGNQDAAMTVWQSAIESAIRMQRPGDAVKGLILLAGQTHRLEAQRLCGKALRLAGETPPSALLLLCARVAHNNKDAAEWYRKILASHSSNSADRVSAHVALARLAEEAGDIRQALDHWKYACKEDASEARND
jgi:tetratricopeptide (TPR) repeat protein